MLIGLTTKRIYSTYHSLQQSKKILLLLGLGSILGPYLGITFSFIAVTHVQVGIAATIMSLQPILMLPISKYLHKETISLQSIAGAFLAVLGIAMLFLR
jgi:drug/metabolite transporter (DMT)-like permease